MSKKQWMSQIKAKFDQLDGKKRENLIRGSVIVGGLAFLLVVYYGMNKDDHQPAVAKEESAVAVELGDERLEDDIRAQVEREREEQQNKNKQQDTELQRTREEAELLKKQIEALTAVLGASDGTAALPAVETGVDPLSDAPPTGPRPRGPNDPMQWAMNAGTNGEQLAAELKVEYVGGIGRIATAAPTQDEAEKKSGRKFFLPVSYMPAKVLTGLRAKTTDAASKDPEPMMLRVQAPAILPNEVRAQLEGCFVVAHGFGSLASERVESRLVSLSCVDYEGRSVIEAPLTGVVVDKDGVKGLAAHPVTKMGANMARLFLAGIVEGAGDAYRQQSSVTSISPLGQTQTVDPNRVGQAAIGSGIQRGSNELTKVYVELVRQSAPVLEMGPGKDAMIFLTQGVWLEIKDYEA